MKAGDRIVRNGVTLVAVPYRDTDRGPDGSESIVCFNCEVYRRERKGKPPSVCQVDCLDNILVAPEEAVARKLTGTSS